MIKPSVLLVHNRYLNRGGEEKQVDEQARLLNEKNHTVHRYEEDTLEFKNKPALHRCLAMVQMPFSFYHYRKMRMTLRSLKPSLMHVHNVFPLLTPSIYYAAAAENIPVVQSVHNYRFMCSNGLFLLPDGTLCERCRTGSHWNAVRQNCYGGKRARSIAMAFTLSLHRAAATFRKHINAYVMTSDFLKNKLISGGFSGRHMHVLPPLFESTARRTEEQDSFRVLFVGRLSREKGLGTLLNAAVLRPEWQFDIVGKGPLSNDLQKTIQEKSLARVNLLGSVSYDRLQILLQKATFLVVPSECYENFPTVFLEAWSYGLPVIASRLGGMAEAVKEGLNGFLFTPGNAEVLAALMGTLTLEKSRSMRDGILRQFESTYASDFHYQKLMQVYESVLDQSPSN